MKIPRHCLIYSLGLVQVLVRVHASKNHVASFPFGSQNGKILETGSLFLQGHKAENAFEELFDKSKLSDPSIVATGDSNATEDFQHCSKQMAHFIYKQKPCICILNHSVCYSVVKLEPQDNLGFANVFRNSILLKATATRKGKGNNSSKHGTDTRRTLRGDTKSRVLLYASSNGSGRGGQRNHVYNYDEAKGMFYRRPLEPVNFKDYADYLENRISMASNKSSYNDLVLARDSSKARNTKAKRKNSMTFLRQLHEDIFNASAYLLIFVFIVSLALGLAIDAIHVVSSHRQHTETDARISSSTCESFRRFFLFGGVSSALGLIIFLANFIFRRVHFG